jgi:transcriptional regulator with XRE-family HTH domain
VAASFDVEALDYQEAIRGLNDAQLARIAGIRQATISDARHGRKRLGPRALTKLSVALARTPLLPAAGLSLIKKNADRGSLPVGVSQEAGNGTADFNEV